MKTWFAVLGFWLVVGTVGLFGEETNTMKDRLPAMYVLTTWAEAPLGKMKFPDEQTKLSTVYMLGVIHAAYSAVEYLSLSEPTHFKMPKKYDQGQVIRVINNMVRLRPEELDMTPGEFVFMCLWVEYGLPEKNRVK